MAGNRHLLPLLPCATATVTGKTAAIRRLLPCYGCYRVEHTYARTHPSSYLQGNKGNMVTNPGSSRAGSVTFRERNGNNRNISVRPCWCTA